jgi:hypothetical protein
MSRFYPISLAILLIVIGMVSYSCQPVTVAEGGRTPFFDLADFIDKYIEDPQQFNVSKTVEIDGQVETIDFSDYDLYADIAGFENYDINRPALFDKYDVDTILAADQSYLFVHQAKEDNLKVQELTVKKEGSQIDSIGVTAVTNSFLEKMQLRLSWIPASGYEINVVSKKVFQDSLHQTVRVTKT